MICLSITHPIGFMWFRGSTLCLIFPQDSIQLYVLWGSSTLYFILQSYGTQTGHRMYKFICVIVFQTIHFFSCSSLLRHSWAFVCLLKEPHHLLQLLLQNCSNASVSTPVTKMFPSTVSTLTSSLSSKVFKILLPLQTMFWLSKENPIISFIPYSLLYMLGICVAVPTSLELRMMAKSWQ